MPSEHGLSRRGRRSRAAARLGRRGYAARWRHAPFSERRDQATVADQHHPRSCQADHLWALVGDEATDFARRLCQLDAIEAEIGHHRETVRVHMNK